MSLINGVRCSGPSLKPVKINNFLFEFRAECATEVCTTPCASHNMQLYSSPPLTLVVEMAGTQELAVPIFYLDLPLLAVLLLHRLLVAKVG